MALFGFRSKNDDNHDDTVRTSAKAELGRRLQRAQAEHDRNPSDATRAAFLDAQREFNEL